jgi:hydroxyquinol 1,2-dioxygenase
MNDFDESNITKAVLERFQAAPDPRLRAIMAGIVKHLHACVREIEPTFEEWMAAIQFLTRTGQISVGGRQEFILLSDTLGVSMLIDAVNNRLPAGATATTVLGPFYLPDRPVKAQGTDLGAGAQGEPLYVDARFLSVDGKPLRRAVVDVWQSDHDGFYDVQQPDSGKPSLRGRFLADDEGRVRFWTVMPTAYPIPYDGPVGDMLKATERSPWRPAHLHFMANAEGYRTLVTHIFVAGDSHLETDPVFGVKQSLIDEFPEQPASAPPPAGLAVAEPWRKLVYEFRLGEAAPRS